MSEREGILISIEAVERHNHGFIGCDEMFVRGYLAAQEAIVNELRKLAESSPVVGDYMEGLVEGIRIGRAECGREPE